MKAKQIPVFLAAVIVSSHIGLFAAVSDAVLVDATCRYRHWTTVYTNEVPLRWQWPEAAVGATLEIAGMGGTFTTNFTEAVSGFLWRAFATEAPSTEDVHDLTLRFYGSGGVPIETQTARLAVVKGAFGAVAVDAAADSRSWARVKDNALIPYDGGWTNASAGAVAAELAITRPDGVAQTNVFNDAAGYYGWKLRNSEAGYGTFELTLAFPGTDAGWDAALTHAPCGTMIIMR
jgi:hypothetical protein